jgi:hypothetical protein
VRRELIGSKTLHPSAGPELHVGAYNNVTPRKQIKDLRSVYVIRHVVVPRRGKLSSNQERNVPFWRVFPPNGHSGRLTLPPSKSPRERETNLCTLVHNVLASGSMKLHFTSVSSQAERVTSYRRLASRDPVKLVNHEDLKLQTELL